MIEMEMAHRHDVDRRRVEARPDERRQDRVAGVAAARAELVVGPLADARLDEDAAGWGLDEQAVERLDQAVVVGQLGRDVALPEQPRDGAEDRPGVGQERARLDERDGRAAAEVSSTSGRRR